MLRNGGITVGNAYKELESELRIHYRMLVLDENAERAEQLEESFLTLPENEDLHEEIHPAFLRCQKAIFYFVQNRAQLSALPNAAGFNVIWLHMDFPQALSLALQFYSENPFCYVILYGGKPSDIFPFLHARPVGYIKNILSAKRVHQELLHIWSMGYEYDEIISLRSRNAYYNISTKSIMYCQSQGRKTYIFVDSMTSEQESSFDDPFVLKTNDRQSLFAYEQNARLDEVEQKLNPNQFVRIHQSFLVNKRYVSGLITMRGGWSIQLTGKCGLIVETPVSERFRDVAKMLLNEDRK